MDSDLGEMVFAAEKISKKRLRKGKGGLLSHFHSLFLIKIANVALHAAARGIRSVQGPSYVIKFEFSSTFF